MEHSSKVIIVTGASRGIRRALVIALAKSGCELLLTALEENELTALANEIRSKFSTPAEAIACDLSNLE